MLAQKAGLFVVTLVGVVEQRSVGTFSDPDTMNSVIERLGLMECVLPHIHVLSSTSSSDKASQRDELGSRSPQ